MYSTILLFALHISNIVYYICVCVGTFSWFSFSSFVRWVCFSFYFHHFRYKHFYGLLLMNRASVNSFGYRKERENVDDGIKVERFPFLKQTHYNGTQCALCFIRWSPLNLTISYLAVDGIFDASISFVSLRSHFVSCNFFAFSFLLDGMSVIWFIYYPIYINLFCSTVK